MSQTPGGIPVDGPGVRLIDHSTIKSFHISEAPDGLFKRIMQAKQTMLEHRYTSMPDTSQNPTYKPYAIVKVDGKVVAKIDNHGWTETSNALGAKLSRLMPDEANGVITGPELAKARAEFIAGMLGGTVELAPTAMTQRQFAAIPQPRPVLDVNAMMKDPEYADIQKLKQARTAFLTQQIAQQQEPAQAQEPAPGDQAVAAFLEYMDKSTEEKFFDSFLKSRGMTEEEFEALPPEEKAALLEEFEEEMKKEMVNAAHEKNDRARTSRDL